MLIKCLSHTRPRSCNRHKWRHTNGSRVIALKFLHVKLKCIRSRSERNGMTDSVMTCVRVSLLIMEMSSQFSRQFGRVITEWSSMTKGRRTAALVDSSCLKRVDQVKGTLLSFLPAIGVESIYTFNIYASSMCFGLIKMRCTLLPAGIFIRLLPDPTGHFLFRTRNNILKIVR